MYSPGAVKVAVVVALPSWSVATFGFGGSNFTAPGPRNIVQVSASGGGGVNANSGGAPAPPAAPRPGAPDPAASAPPPASAPRAAPRPRPRPRPVFSGTLIFGPSSVAHTVNVSGTPTVAAYFSASAVGAPVKIGPFSVKRSFGGVFLFAASSYGSTT